MNISISVKAVGINNYYNFASEIIVLKWMVVKLEQGVPLIGLSH